MEKNINRINETDKNNEDFFKVWITKEIIQKNYFEDFYQLFSDKDLSFNEIKYTNILNSIYNIISNYDATTIRPNNIHKLNDKTEKEIIVYGSDKFADEIYLHLRNLNIKNDIKSNDVNINKVRNGLIEFLNNKYEKLGYYPEILMLIKKIIDKTNKVLENKKD